MRLDELVEKLKRQPLDDRGIYLSWQTRDDIIDLLLQCGAFDDDSAVMAHGYHDRRVAGCPLCER